MLLARESLAAMDVQNSVRLGDSLSGGTTGNASSRWF